MKKLSTILWLLLVLNVICYAQDPIFWTDTVKVGNGDRNQEAANLTPMSMQSVNITGNINALIVPVGFSDRQETQAFPTIVSSAWYPLLGVFQDGTTTLKDYVHNHGDTIAEDLWYGPGFNHYFSTESGGLFNVNFSFVKKTTTTRYQTTNPWSYFVNLNQQIVGQGKNADSSVIDNEQQNIINEVAQNMYADNPNVFNNVHHISFTFEGITNKEFAGTGAAGFTYSTIYTISGRSGQPSILYQGPITFQMNAKPIPHEFMHSIGAAVGQPNGFFGFPDRGYSENRNDGSASFHANMAYSYDMMEHNLSANPSQYSLYGIKPLISHDLIFLGWIKPDEILTVDQNNFGSYSDIKLADVNYPLTSQQKSDGYVRVIKVMVPGQSNEYFLVEYHAASEFDKMFNNYDDYTSGGYNTGVLAWHIKEMTSQLGLFSDNVMELLPAVPYNSWYGNPTPNDSYPAHGNFDRSSSNVRTILQQYGQDWWNGIYSGDFNYFDDNRNYSSKLIFFPDGGRHVWETTISGDPNQHGFTSWLESGTVVLPRFESMRSDFFSDSNVKGHVTNSITDGTRPSTKDWGYYVDANHLPVSNPTHIAITNMIRHSGYMTVHVYYNAYGGTLTSNTTISGNAYIAGNLTVGSGVTLTIASGTTLNLLSGSSLTVNGNLVSNVTLTIPSGATMTANPGATLKFASGTSLISNGVLNVNGTSNSRVTFTSITGTSPGSWGSLILSGSGANNSVINYCNFNYGTDLEANNTSNVTIEYCNITDNSSHGIDCYNASYTYVHNNTIANSNIYHGIYFTVGTANDCYFNVIYKKNHNHQGAGIQYSGAGGTDFQNDVDYYNWGIASIWGANVSSYWTNNPHRNNRISNCLYGLMVYANSTGYFGMSPNSLYSWNSIYSNSNYNAAVGYYYPTYVSALYAYSNWWGSATPDPSKFYVSLSCEGYFDNPLPTNPWYGFPLPSGAQSVAGTVPNTECATAPANIPMSEVQQSSSRTDLQDSVFIGLQLMAQNNRNEAKKYLMSFLGRHPENHAAYVALYGCADSITMAEIIAFFKESHPKGPAIQGHLLANLYQMQGKPDLAKKMNDSVMVQYPNTSLEVRAAMSNMLIDLYDNNDIEGAKMLLAKIRSKASLITPMELQDVEAAASLHGVVPTAGSYKVASVANSSLPESFGLSQNYPNPFNPTTTIQYTLPVFSHVTLEVYDVLGRKVETLVNEDEAAGYHSLVLDATNLPSGVYFYRISAGKFVSLKKLVVVK